MSDSGAFIVCKIPLVKIARKIIFFSRYMSHCQSVTVGQVPPTKVFREIKVLRRYVGDSQACIVC